MIPYESYKPDSLYARAYTPEGNSLIITDETYHGWIQNHREELKKCKSYRDSYIGCASFLVVLTLCIVAMAYKVESYYAVAAVVSGGLTLLPLYMVYRMVGEVKAAALELEKDKTVPFKDRDVKIQIIQKL